MPKNLQIQLSPELASNETAIQKAVARKLNISPNRLQHVQIVKRSIDARKKAIKINLAVNAYIDEVFEARQIQLPDYKNVSNESPIIIVGAGPAGLFAALRCIELGFKPIVLERGKDVQTRRRDLKAINIEHKVNGDSNYCFGEGGAGTYSDGKLYTRSKKRGDVRRILELLVGFGATEEILINAHPHIGTNKLPAIIKTMRECIIECGGEVRFNTKVVDFVIAANQIKGVDLDDGTTIKADNVILATGHSARDIFRLLHRNKIEIEAKPFALGVRVEHNQTLIDQIQYSCKVRSPFLPPSPYSIVKQVGGRGMYSFCMCPGGIIAPCATSPGEVVTNGWSPSKRDGEFANSGIVVELREADFAEYHKFGPLAAMEFQSAIEQKAWQLAGESQKVPAQRLADLTKGKRSASIPTSSYKPGTESVNMKAVFPEFIYETLKAGFKAFDKIMRGYLTNEAVVHAPESRTSSPVRIPRDKLTLEHMQIKGLFPCGEGAGYAGGIISAAIDGEKCAEAAIHQLSIKNKKAR